VKRVSPTHKATAAKAIPPAAISDRADKNGFLPEFMLNKHEAARSLRAPADEAGSSRPIAETQRNGYLKTESGLRASVDFSPPC